MGDLIIKSSCMMISMAKILFAHKLTTFSSTEKHEISKTFGKMGFRVALNKGMLHFISGYG